MSETDIEPLNAGQAKPGKYIFLDNDVYVIRSMDKGKSGKHGHAKARIKMRSIFTKKDREIVRPTKDKLMSPKVLKKNAQIVSISSSEAQLMDLEDYEYFDVDLPKSGELLDKLEEGAEVEYWKVVGRTLLVSVKKS